MAKQTAPAGAATEEKAKTGPVDGAPVDMEQGVSPDLLAKAFAAPSNRAMEKINPMARIPTLKVGEEFKAGQVLSGYFSRLDDVETPKNRFATQKVIDGVTKMVSTRIIFNLGSPTGEEIGLWATRELSAAFQNIPTGKFVSLTYKGKGKNAQDLDQHFFDYEVAKGN